MKKALRRSRGHRTSIVWIFFNLSLRNALIIDLASSFAQDFSKISNKKLCDLVRPPPASFHPFPLYFLVSKVIMISWSSIFFPDSTGPISWFNRAQFGLQNGEIQWGTSCLAQGLGFLDTRGVWHPFKLDNINIRVLAIVLPGVLWWLDQWRVLREGPSLCVKEEIGNAGGRWCYFLSYRVVLHCKLQNPTVISKLVPWGSTLRVLIAIWQVPKHQRARGDQPILTMHILQTPNKFWLYTLSGPGRGGGKPYVSGCLHG